MEKTKRRRAISRPRTSCHGQFIDPKLQKHHRLDCRLKSGYGYRLLRRWSPAQIIDADFQQAQYRPHLGIVTEVPAQTPWLSTICDGDDGGNGGDPRQVQLQLRADAVRHFAAKARQHDKIDSRQAVLDHTSLSHKC